MTLPDHVQVHPAHGSGSACGKALGSIPSSTVGYERLYAWWGPYLAADDEQGFIDQLLDGQPDAHAYFGRMKRQNCDGPAMMGARAPLPELNNVVIAADLAVDRITFVDTRTNTDVHEGTVAGELNIPNAGKFATYAAWAYDPEADSRPLVLLAAGQEAAMDMWDHLVRVGIDTVIGYTTDLDGLRPATPKLIHPEEVADFAAAALLDVRNNTEYADGTIPVATHLGASRVLWQRDTLPAEGTIVMFCQTGIRNSVAASALRRAGHDVVEVDGAYEAYAAWQASMQESLV